MIVHRTILTDQTWMWKYLKSFGRLKGPNFQWVFFFEPKNGQRTEYKTFIFGHNRGAEHILIVSSTTVLKSDRKILIIKKRQYLKQQFGTGPFKNALTFKPLFSTAMFFDWNDSWKRSPSILYFYGMWSFCKEGFHHFYYTVKI